MAEPEGRYLIVAPAGRPASVSILQCGDCGAVITHRVLHNRWHDKLWRFSIERSGEVPAGEAVREQMGDAPMDAYLNVDDVSGVARIAAERVRQVQEEGWSTEHDDQWTDGELLDGAMAYLWAAEDAPDYGRSIAWPFDGATFKPSDDPIRNLEKAGAMIAAEIDREIRTRGN